MRIETIDAQVHIVDPRRPPASALFSRPEQVRPISAPEMVKEMNIAGVDAAVLVSMTYEDNTNCYELETAAAHPERFRVVGMIDHNAADVEDQIERWAALPLTVGLRMLLTSDEPRDQLVGGAYESYLAAAGRMGVPICVYAPRYLRELDHLIGTHPDVLFILDHFGFLGHFSATLAVRRLPAVLHFAQYANVSVKLTGGLALSALEYPFEDLWPLYAGFISRFGAHRLMWGTDWTRVYNGTYSDGVRHLLESERISTDDKVALMGGTLRSILGWG